VVRDSARGSVTGTARLRDTQGAIGQSVAAAANDRTFVIAANIIAASTLPGTAAILYFRLLVSADGRPGTLTELTPGLGNGEPLTGMALSPDGTMLALSLIHEGFLSSTEPYGDIELVNLATGKIRTWTGRSEPDYWPGVPTWIYGDTMLTFAWWHTVSLDTGAAVIAGIGQLHVSAPDNDLMTSPFDSFPTPVRGIQSAIMSNPRVMIASSCRDADASGGYHGTATARILELSAVRGKHLGVLRTQTVTFSSTAAEQARLAACAVLSVDPSGDHLLVQAFGFGRIDNGVFTALPGGSPGPLGTAAAW
jgi:hypothetical protein